MYGLCFQSLKYGVATKNLNRACCALSCEVHCFSLRSRPMLSRFVNVKPLSKFSRIPSSSQFLFYQSQRNINIKAFDSESHGTTSSRSLSESVCRPSSKSERDDKSESKVDMDSQKNDFTLNKQDDSLDIFDNINYEEIVGKDCDNDTLNKFKLLLLEVDVLRQDGCKVPKKLTSVQWKELFTLQTRNQRRKMLQFLWTKDIRKINDKKKKEIKKIENEERSEELKKERDCNEHIHYGFGGNTIFLRVYDTTINQFDNQRLIRAMMFGLNVVIDCGYDENMSVIENSLCAKQLCYLFAENRLHRDPFNLNFCNFKKDTVLFSKFKNFIPTLDDPGFPINITEEHYTRLFPKEKLVYLTPHCRTEMKDFNPDDVYIIGALVDRQNNEPLSMAKAKSEGIRMAKFPLDRYLDWHLGTKSLTINQVLKILLDMNATQDWNTALSHVPTRKLRLPGQPKLDQRKIKYRGTIFQPPPNYRESKRQW